MAYNQLPLDNNSGNTSYSVPNPSILEVKKYLKSWSELENYKLQEDALDKLFFELIPKNEDISDILLKVATTAENAVSKLSMSILTINNIATKTVEYITK